MPPTVDINIITAHLKCWAARRAGFLVTGVKAKPPLIDPANMPDPRSWSWGARQEVAGCGFGGDPAPPLLTDRNDPCMHGDKVMTTRWMQERRKGQGGWSEGGHHRPTSRTAVTASSVVLTPCPMTKTKTGAWQVRPLCWPKIRMQWWVVGCRTGFIWELYHSPGRSGLY